MKQAKKTVTKETVTNETIETTINNKALELLEESETLQTLKNNFLKLENDGFFRINSKNELLTLNELIIKKHYDGETSKLIQANNEEIKKEKPNKGNIETNIKKIETLQSELKELVKPVKATLNQKSQLTDYDKKLFFSIDGLKLLLTSCKMTNNKIDKATVNKITVTNTTKTINSLKHYEATKALQTAFNDCNDYKFYKLQITNKQLELQLVDSKNMKTRYYGILGTAKKDNSIA